jgi:serine phosphatase RsbU (regulator of sigma subunit)
MQNQFLARIPLFSSLPAEEILHLEATLPASAFPADQVLFREGFNDDKFYILLEGSVEVVKALGTPEERILGIREAGNLLGELSLFTKEGCHTASVRSTTSLLLLKVSRVELDALLHRQPQFAYEIIRLISNRLDESENLTILDLKQKNKDLKDAYDALKSAQEQIIEKEKLEKELEISRQIQQSILPDSLPVISFYDFGALMIPARAVGGDFYTFIKLRNNRMGIVVGDVSDKGVPAALFMALTYSLIRAEGLRTGSPSEALSKVNLHLLQMNSSCMFVTMVYGILDCNSGDFHFARAGHPSPYLLDGNGCFVNIPIFPSQPLGLFEDPTIDEQTIHLPTGCTLLLYSDGVNENIDSLGNEFGLESIYQTMASIRQLSAQDICEQLFQRVQTHGENQPQQDDFTSVVVKRSNNI